MTIYVANKQAFVEIYPDYLLRVGDEKDVCKLNNAQIWQLVRSIVAMKIELRNMELAELPGVVEET